MYPSAVDATEPLKPVVLKCRAKGTPTPEINWYKDGLLIKGSPEESGFQVTLEGSLVLVGKRFHITREGSLIIFDPRMEDEGKYTCAAENKLGKISYDVSLYVETSECLFSFAIPLGNSVVSYSSIFNPLHFACTSNSLKSSYWIFSIPCNL